jgi:hypothetical protein
MTAQIPKNLDWFAPFEKFLGSGFLEVITIEQKEILRVTPPFTVKFEPAAIQKILKGLTQRVERGGILACRPIMDGMIKVLCVERAIFVPNASVNPRDCYEPSPNDWNKAMAEVFFKDQILPVEFHSHPISRRKPGEKLLEYFYQMGASPEDQLIAEPILEIGNYRIAIPQAILIKDVQTREGFFTGIYGGLIAPKDFEPDILNAGGKRAIQLGEKILKWFQQYLSDPKKKEAGKAIGVGSIIAGFLFPQVAISLLGFLLGAGFLCVYRLLPLMESIIGEEMPYFGFANVSRTLRIKIPYFDIANYSLKELQTIKLKEKKLKSVAGIVK